MYCNGIVVGMVLWVWHALCCDRCGMCIVGGMVFSRGGGKEGQSPPPPPPPTSLPPP